MIHRKNGSIIWYIVVFCCLLWGLGHWFNTRQPGMVEYVSSYVMYPILVAQHSIVKPIKNYFETRKSQQELESVVKKLLDERQELLAQNVQLNAMLSYVEQTDELVSFKKQFGINDATIAQVLVKHFSDNGQYFLIDKGVDAGIIQDMVVVFKNCLLGKIVEVYPRYSKVLLVTDKQCKVAAYCAHTRSSGIHQGMNMENQTGLHYVSHLSEIEPGDLVLSSGDGLVFPKGFALGKITLCDPQGLFYKVAIQPLIDLRKIDYCFVMQKGATQSPQAQQALIALCEQHENEQEHNLATTGQAHEQHIVVTSQIQIDQESLGHGQVVEQITKESHAQA